jgi:hypothetical protein
MQENLKRKSCIGLILANTVAKFGDAYLRCEARSLYVQEEGYRTRAALAHVDMLHCPTGLKPDRAVATAKCEKLALTRRSHGRWAYAYRTFA